MGIIEIRIIKLCKENRIEGAVKNGMVWEIPEEALKPSDKRSNIYKYIHTQKRIMIVSCIVELKEYLLKLLEKEGYIVDFENFNSIKDNLDNVSKYYEGLIYFPINNIDKDEELFINNFSNKLNSESSVVIVNYNEEKRNKIEKKLANKFKSEIGFRINTLVLDIPKNKEMIINYDEIAEDILQLLTKFKNTTGMNIITDCGMIEFDNNGRTKPLETGKFYRAINNYFKRLNKESYLWSASTMLEDEWTEEPLEMNFRVVNLEVANRGTKIDRIFIFSKSKIKEFKNNKTLKIYMQSNINTMFVDYDEINFKEPKLLEIVGDGWDGIDKSTLIADLPAGNKERGYVSINKKEVQKAFDCFQRLKTYAKDLKDILK